MQLSLSSLITLFYYVQITHMEMIKGIQGHGYYDELVVPIIENTAHERELTDSLAEAVGSRIQITFPFLRCIYDVHRTANRVF